MIKYPVLSVMLIFAGLCSSGSIQAQNNTRSPYSSRGLGEIEPFEFSLNKSLGGVANGLRSSRFISIANPASLSGLSDHRVVFDFGVRGDYGQTKSGNNRYDYNNGNFSYLSLAMPVLTIPDKYAVRDTTHGAQSKLRERSVVWALAFGATPYSNIGSYYFKTTDTTFADYTTTFSNSGGLTNIFLSNGVNINRHLSVGLTTSFLFGQITSYKFQYFTDTLNYFHFDDERIYHLKGFKNEFGLQYQTNFGKGKEKKWRLVAGATYSVASNLKYNLTRLSRSYDDLYAKDTLLYENNVSGTTGIPGGFSLGYSLTYDNRWMLAMDYKQTNWSKQTHTLFKDSFANSSRFSVGIAFKPDIDPENVKRDEKNRYKLHPEYRLGFHYLNTGSYFKGSDGSISAIKEYGISFGIGIPKIMTDRYDNKRLKSMINITGEYISRGQNSNGLVLENIYRLTLGFTINDGWFHKAQYR